MKSLSKAAYVSLAAFVGVLQRDPGNTAGKSVDRSMIILEISKHKSARSDPASGA